MTIKQKYLFIDRDGTLIEEPADEQIDSLEKFKLVPHVIPALLQLQQAGFKLVMVSNQDGLGTESFPTESFTAPHQLLLDILASQGIHFDDIHICPHLPSDYCSCRKPNIMLVKEYFAKMDPHCSYVIGDRETDKQFAKNMGIHSFIINDNTNWQKIAATIQQQPRTAKVIRTTNETDIEIHVDLDHDKTINVDTGIGFFDHMLEQFAKHGDFGLIIKLTGDLHIDDHHTVEDTALTLGEALRQALGDKRGIERYGYVLPMDEALAHIALDLSGRPYYVFHGDFKREKIGELSTELVPHFFHSLSQSLGANLHMRINGSNDHHMVEVLFKGIGRAFKMAHKIDGNSLPSTKGVL